MAPTPEEPFAQAADEWDLEKLYKDLSAAKRLVAPHKRRGLTDVEKLHLCGLLCEHSPTEIAQKLHKNAKGVEVELSKTLYRYTEQLTGRLLNTLQNWRDVIDWLEAAKYRIPTSSVSKEDSFPPVVPQPSSESSNLRAILRHSDKVLSVAISPDGKIFASGSHDKTIKIWSLHSGELLRTLCGHTSGVLFVAISPDGKTLLSRSHGGAIRLWNLHSGEMLRFVMNLSPYQPLAISSDWQTVAIGSHRDSMIALWNLHSGKLLNTFFVSVDEDNNEKDYILSIAISFDSQILACSVCRNTVFQSITTHTTLLNLHGELLYTFADDTDTGLTISPDGQTFVCYDLYGIRLRNLHNGKLLRTIQPSNRVTSPVTISNDGQILAFGCVDGTIRLWNPDSGQLLRTLEGHSAPVTSVAISLDSQTLVSGSEDGTVRIWNL